MSLSLDIGLACNECGKPLGRVDQDEFNAIISGRFGKTLCFDCDPGEADKVPMVFEDTMKNDRLRLSGYKTIFIGPRPLSRTRARAHSYLSINSKGSSSVTYLNTGEHNDSFLSRGVHGYPCRVCEGNGEFTTGRITVECSFCEGEGYVITALILPKWLLGLGCEHA